MRPPDGTEYRNPKLTAQRVERFIENLLASPELSGKRIANASFQILPASKMFFDTPVPALVAYFIAEDVPAGETAPAYRFRFFQDARLLVGNEAANRKLYAREVTSKLRSFIMEESNLRPIALDSVIALYGKPSELNRPTTFMVGMLCEETEEPVYWEADLVSAWLTERNYSSTKQELKQLERDLNDWIDANKGCRPEGLTLQHERGTLAAIDAQGSLTNVLIHWTEDAGEKYFHEKDPRFHVILSEKPVGPLLTDPKTKYKLREILEAEALREVGDWTGEPENDDRQIVAARQVTLEGKTIRGVESDLFMYVILSELKNERQDAPMASYSMPHASSKRRRPSGAKPEKLPLDLDRWAEADLLNYCGITSLADRNQFADQARAFRTAASTRLSELGSMWGDYRGAMTGLDILERTCERIEQCAAVRFGAAGKIF